ncbi:ComEC/Rec2 family competence protein [Mucilaginibacter litoreus]|uniref:ComEC/Rec2 family competence protein n=1 Tax=Mucilaginibacter litoreus TaxID=1048221 RepID=A0ABW3AV59_9SPHI
MIAGHKGEIPFLILTLPFLTGIACALCLLNSNPNFIATLLIALTTLFIGLNLTYNHFKLHKVRWLGGLLIVPLLFLLGWLVTLLHYEKRNDNYFTKQRSNYLVVNISSEPVVKNNMVRFNAEVVGSVNQKNVTKTSGNLLITIKDERALNLFYGQQLLIPSKYTEVEPPYNPGEFNYKAYLANKNIFYQSFLYPGQYKAIDYNKGNRLIAYAVNLRQQLVAKLKRNMHDSTAIAVASTLILGYKADLSNDVLQAYSKTGTIHILSVSGGHVAIIYGLLIYMLAFMNNKRSKLLRSVIIITLIWSYALLTGFSPAVCRAAAMISLVIAGKTYNRYINNLNLLAASAFILLLLNPFLLKDVGFQLSYLAVFGLVIFQPVIYKQLLFKNYMANKLWLFCSVSIAAQLITFPLSAYYFHQFPVYFLVSNLLIILPVTIVMYAGITLLLLPQISWLSAALGYVTEKSILSMNKMLVVIERSPYAGINKIWLTRFEHLLLYAIILFGMYFLYHRKIRWMYAALLCILLFVISIDVKKIKTDKTNSVTFLSLRKHKGIIFKAGNRGLILSDLPSTDKNFAYSVQPCLDSLRIISYKVLPFYGDTSTTYFVKKHGIVWFRNKKLLLLNDSSHIKSIPKTLAFNALYVSDNMHVNDSLARHQQIILDGTNSDTYIKNVMKLNVNNIILKRNKSLTILSN